jgi:hypothetical protein
MSVAPLVYSCTSMSVSRAFFAFFCAMQLTSTANSYECRLHSDLTVSWRWNRDTVKSYVFLAIKPHGTHSSRLLCFALYQNKNKANE